MVDFSKDDDPFAIAGKGGKFDKDAYLPSIKDGDKISIRILAEMSDKKNFKRTFRHEFVRIDKEGKIIHKTGKLDKAAGEKFVGSFTCINSRENLSKGIVCPICESGEKPKAKFYVPVIDRTDGKVKIFTGGPMVFGLIDSHNKANESITNVDFTYSRTGSGQNDTEYFLNPEIKSVGLLKKEDLELLATINLDVIVEEKSREDILKAVGNIKVEETHTEEVEEVVPF